MRNHPGAVTSAPSWAYTDEAKIHFRLLKNERSDRGLKRRIDRKEMRDPVGVKVRGRSVGRQRSR